MTHLGGDDPEQPGDRPFGEHPGARPDGEAPEGDRGPDTVPLPGQPPAGPRPGPYGPPYGPPAFQQPRPPAAYPPPAFQPPFPPVFGAPAYRPAPRAGLPGWLVPVLAAAALVTGLVGGLLGGALVLGTSGSGESGGTDGDTLPPAGSAAPLDADNTSVAAVAAKVLPSTVQVRVVNGRGESATGATGSGFVIDRDGHVITNNHVVEVVEDDGVIEVLDVSGRSHDAEIVGRSPVYDLAVLEIEKAEGLQPAALGSSRQMQVGQTVVAIGSPLGLSSTVTSGIVSALDRPVTTGPSGPSDAESPSFINAVQTDAAINPGNSGGPLVNLRGQVVGVNSAIATTGGILGGEGGNIGVGFAIPMEQVRFTAEQILETGKAEYPVIGANVNTGESTNGATVVEVPGGTPAEEAGLRKGDRIVAVEGKRVPDGISLIVAIRTHRPGETITFTIVRDGEEQELDIELDAKVG